MTEQAHEPADDPATEPIGRVADPITEGGDPPGHVEPAMTFEPVGTDPTDMPEPRPDPTP